MAEYAFSRETERYLNYVTAGVDFEEAARLAKQDVEAERAKEALASVEPKKED